MRLKINLCPAEYLHIIFIEKIEKNKHNYFQWI